MRDLLIWALLGLILWAVAQGFVAGLDREPSYTAPDPSVRQRNIDKQGGVYWQQ